MVRRCLVCFIRVADIGRTFHPLPDGDVGTSPVTAGCWLLWRPVAVVRPPLLWRSGAGRSGAAGCALRYPDKRPSSCSPVDVCGASGASAPPPAALPAVRSGAAGAWALLPGRASFLFDTGGRQRFPAALCPLHCVGGGAACTVGGCILCVCRGVRTVGGGAARRGIELKRWVRWVRRPVPVEEGAAG